MQVEVPRDPEPALVAALREHLAHKKEPELFAVYLQTLINDVQTLAKSPIAALSSPGVYLYSVAKKYLERLSDKSVQNPEHLFEFFHGVVRCIAAEDPAKLNALFQKDATIEKTLASHIGSVGLTGRSPKYLFDVLLMVLRAKEQAPQGAARSPEVLSLVWQAAMDDSDFLRHNAQKFLAHLLELQSGHTAQVLALIQSKATPILDGWFVKSKEASRTLEVLRKTQTHFSVEAKLGFVERAVRIAEGKAAEPLKIKAFELLENVFASSYFSVKATAALLDALNRLEEEFLAFLTNKRLVIAFFKARLQILLNFYALDPSAARPHVPAFVSALFEFFASDTFEEAMQQQQEDAPAVPVGRAKSGRGRREEPSEARVALTDVEETFRFYKRFSFRLFDLLIANCFDAFLFAELEPNSGDRDMHQLTDLLQNMDLEGTQNSLAGQSSVAKLFALLAHTVSSRFEKNFEFTLRILSKIIAKVNQLGFGKSPIFNEHLGRFYRAAQAILAQPGISAASSERLWDFQADILGAGDLTALIPAVFQINTQQQFDASNLENPEFVAFLEAMARKAHHFRFAALQTFFFMVVTFAVDSFAGRDRQDAMVTEEPTPAEGSPLQLQKKLEDNLTLRLVSSIHKFDQFDVTDLARLPELAENVVSSLLSSAVSEHPFLTKQFLSVLNGLLLAVITHRARVAPASLQQFEALLKTQAVLPKVCKAYVQWGSQKDRTHFENFLKLYARLFPSKATADLILKNILRLEKLLKTPETFPKGLAEVPLVVALLTGFDNIAQQNELLVHSLKFSQTLLATKQGGLKLGFKMLTGLLNNLPVSHFGPLLTLVEGVLQGFLTAATPGKHFEGASLKFLRKLVAAYALNLSPADFQTQMHAFCEKYLSLVVLNFKNRSKKTRKAAQAVLGEMVESFHHLDKQLLGEGRHPPVIDDKSFVVCCVVAGLAGETALAKANSVEAIAFLLKEFWSALSPSLVQSLTRVALLLIREKNGEVYGSVLKYISRLLKKSVPAKLEAELPVLVEAVFEWDADSAKRASAKLKTLVSLFNRKFVR